MFIFSTSDVRFFLKETPVRDDSGVVGNPQREMSDDPNRRMIRRSPPGPATNVINKGDLLFM